MTSEKPIQMSPSILMISRSNTAVLLTLFLIGASPRSSHPAERPARGGLGSPSTKGKGPPVPNPMGDVGNGEGRRSSPSSRTVDTPPVDVGRESPRQEIVVLQAEEPAPPAAMVPATARALLRQGSMRRMVDNLVRVGSLALRLLERDPGGLSETEIAAAREDIHAFKATMTSITRTLRFSGRPSRSAIDPADIDLVLASAGRRSLQTFLDLQGKLAGKLLGRLVGRGYFEAMQDLTTEESAQELGLIEPDELDEARIRKIEEEEAGASRTESTPGKAELMRQALEALEISSRRAARPIQQGKQPAEEQQVARRELEKFAAGIQKTRLALEEAVAGGDSETIRAAVREANQQTCAALATLGSGPAAGLLAESIGPEYGALIAALGA